MSSNRSILNLRYTPVSSGAGRKAARLFHYIQNRDNEREGGEVRDPESFMYYAAYRDRAQPQGRMFDAEYTVGDRERLDLVQHIRDSTRGARDGDRAFYQMVISPENGREVDLRELTRATMRQMGRDCGELPWIAAEHRNTEHPHVHVVMAAKREREPGRYKTVVINRQRLGRAKEAMTSELDRQHDRTKKRQREPGPQLQRAVQQPWRSYRPEQALTRGIEGSRGLAAAVSMPKERSGIGRGVGKAMGAMAQGLAGFFEAGQKAMEEVERQREKEREKDREWER